VELLLPLIGFWIVCGIAGGAIASSKGGSGAGGFFAGLLLGPIGVLMAFAMGSPAQLQNKQILAGQMKRCPQCAQVVPKMAVICHYCRHDFPAAEAAAAAYWASQPVASASQPE
jgi:hypothetical protein